MGGGREGREVDREGVKKGEEKKNLTGHQGKQRRKGVGLGHWPGPSGPGSSVSLQCHHPKSLCVLVLENSLLASEPWLLEVLGLADAAWRSLERWRGQPVKGLTWPWAGTVAGGTLTRAPSTPSTASASASPSGSAGLWDGGTVFLGATRRRGPTSNRLKGVVPMSDLRLELWPPYHSFNQYLFHTHYVPDLVLGSKQRTMYKRDHIPFPHGTHIPVGGNRQETR